MTSRLASAPLRRLDGRVSRRGLLGAGVLAGVLAASGVPLRARSRGGVLRLGLASPLPVGEDWDKAPLALAPGAVYETLAAVGPTGELGGELAQSWEAAPGARVWQLALRPEARFHDGRPVRSEDVVASLEHHRRGRSAWALARVERIEPQGALGVALTLAEGDPDFPFLLAEPGLIIGPNGRFDGTGSGLYRLAPQQPEGRLRLERVSSHWKDGRAGWFDAVEASFIEGPSGRLEALLADEVDALGPLPPGMVEHAREAGFAVTAVQGNRQLHVSLPRRAEREIGDLLPRMVDRAAMAAARNGRAAADQPLGLRHPALAAIEPPAFDPVLAQRLEGVEVRTRAWEGCPTEEATFRKALAGPWAPIRRHPALVRELEAARRTAGEERLAHYAAAQAICAETAIVVVAAHVPAVTLHGRSLAHDDAVSPYAPFDGGRIAERWWFA
jgi:peptide/nickel transport system substrate-binding protein